MSPQKPSFTVAVLIGGIVREQGEGLKRHGRYDFCVFPMTPSLSIVLATDSDCHASVRSSHD
jgi:hypothetical protein